MIITSFSSYIFIAYCLHDFDAVPGIVESVTVAVEDFAVAHGMQVGEAVRKFDLFTINSDGAKGCFFSFFGL